ncbi:MULTISPECIES: cation:proton antiporter domain-containing protein [unclassified Nocardioides]|uniref:cation:proton antiporter domain-containing protein n=1 Tax=Nocardioides sp. URHA0032 TaxID=1380388 RepID=UPI00048AE92B|nr:cation:proton antiporter [Nocardioides sp. URHA0032]
MTADLVYLVAGASLLLAIVLPALLDRWAVSAPMVLVTVGLLLGLTPLPDGMPLDPQANRATIEHVTELVVLVALMGVGLALDRPLEVRRWASWRRWGATWRLLGISMPLTIGAIGLLGWAAGLPAAAAVLLGAVLSPTDPVLASDVQVAGPQTGDHEVDEDDEVRFTLTSEAGLNDGLAFPFVYAAILLATHGALSGWVLEWVGWYLVGKVLLGVLAGILVGRVLAYAAFRSSSASLRVAERGESLMALAALVSAYGVGQVVGGYGFLSVFACAMTFRSAERSHDYHAAMHEVAERLERLLTLFVLLVLGIATTRGLFGSLDWKGVAIAVALVLVVRPLAGTVGLHGCLEPDERRTVAFFGVRGIGSIYYLAYAGGEAEGLATDWMWSTVSFAIVLSVFVHGALAAPVMRRLESSRS